MTNYRRQLLIKANKLFDLVVLAFAFAVSSLVVFATNTPAYMTISQFLSTRIKIQNLLLLFLLFASWHLIFQLAGIYRSRRIGLQISEFIDIVKATTICMVLLLTAGFIFRISLISNTFLFTFWSVSSCILIISRIVLHFTLKQMRIQGRNTRQMVIIGTGKRAQDFANKISQTPELGYRIVGFVDNQWEGLAKFNNNGRKLLGNLDDLQEILKVEVIDEVVVSLPVKSYYDKISSIINLCEGQGIIVRYLSDLFDLKIAKSYIDYLDTTPLLTLHAVPVEQWPLVIKRSLDLTLSCTLILLLLPLFLLIAIVIKLDSKGPIFFIQERVGLNKRKFKLLKFRTMQDNADQLLDQLKQLNEVSGPVFKIKDDPRLTRVGKWLRKTSADELPQLINVIKGDMSLVGPRPPIQSEVEQYECTDRRRLSMKPGITCLWQINGRSNVSFERWMELDKEYIDNWSLWTDVKILAKTIPVVIRGTGAS